MVVQIKINTIDRLDGAIQGIKSVRLIFQYAEAYFVGIGFTYPSIWGLETRVKRNPSMAKPRRSAINIQRAPKSSSNNLCKVLH